MLNYYYHPSAHLPLPMLLIWHYHPSWVNWVDPTAGNCGGMVPHTTTGAMGHKLAILTMSVEVCVGRTRPDRLIILWNFIIIPGTDRTVL